MSEEENKKMMRHIFSELSKGNDEPFIEAMADEMKWHWMGTGHLSKSFKGKSSVLNELWSSVKTTITQPYTVVPHRFIADGDYVVIEHTGHNSTTGGIKYNNKYCWVILIKTGKIHEINEYMDTELVTQVFKS